MPTAETMRIMLMMKMMIMFTLCFLTFGFLWCQFFFMKFRLCFSPPAPIFAPAASFTTKHSLTPTLPFSPFVIIMIMTIIMIIIIMIIPSENRLIHESVRNSDVLVRRRSPPGPANDAERNVQIVHFHTVRLP